MNALRSTKTDVSTFWRDFCDAYWEDYWQQEQIEHNRQHFWRDAYRAATKRSFRWPVKPKGQCLLPRCETLLPKGRRRWCSTEHMRIGYNQSTFRAAVRWFYGSLCALCEVDTDAIGAFEADHIVPVIEGGASSLENGRVLCLPCHKGETAKLRARLAMKRNPSGRWSDHATTFQSRR